MEIERASIESETEANKIAVKFKNGNSIRRQSIDCPPRFNQLKRKIKASFPNLEDDFVITYLDDEDDTITITCNRELNEAFAVAASLGRILRLSVNDQNASDVKSDSKNVENSTAPSAQSEPKEEEKASPIGGFPSVYMHAMENMMQMCASYANNASDKADQYVKPMEEKFNRQASKSWKQIAGKMASGWKKGWRKVAKVHRNIQREVAKESKKKWKLLRRNRNKHFQKNKLTSKFVRDGTLPDATEISPGKEFTKKWIINSGCSGWPEGCILLFVNGHHMDAKELRVPIPASEPDTDVEISVNFTAPKQEGRYKSFWRMTSPQGERFGHRFWVDIIVNSGDNDHVDNVLAESIDESNAEGSGESMAEKESANVDAGEVEIDCVLDNATASFVVAGSNDDDDAKPTPKESATGAGVTVEAVTPPVVNVPYAEQARQLIDMGFQHSFKNLQQALVNAAGDINVAISSLINSASQ